jgi:zinc transporter 5/7
VLCLGIVSVAVFMLVLPLFKATGNILLQIAPGNVAPSAFIKCGRQVNKHFSRHSLQQFQNLGRRCLTADMAIVLQITAYEDVSELSQGRFWELVPGHAVGCLSVQVR